jgi:peptidoglycan/LPS O-acetylase OafA/YrhL
MAVYADSVVHAEANFGILRIIPEFLYGVGLYRLGETLRLSSRASKVASILSAVAMVATMHFRMDDRLIVVLAGALVLSLALFAKAHQGQRSNPLLIEGGEASFALYLVHMPVLIGWKGIASILRDMPSSYDLSRMEVVVVLALTLAAAWAVHRLIERPARDWLRFRIDRRWPSGPHGLSPAGAQPPDV